MTLFQFNSLRVGDHVMHKHGYTLWTVEYSCNAARFGRHGYTIISSEGHSLQLTESNFHKWNVV